MELEATTVGLVQDVEHAPGLNETLKKSLHEVHVDLLSAGDEAFDRAKAQELCLKPDLDVFEMDFIKTVVDGRLVNMDEAYLESGVYKDAMTDDPTPVTQEDEQHDV